MDNYKISSMCKKDIVKGVYCLTSPSGKRYVGVGMNYKGINERWSAYMNLRCKGQINLYNALKKYGPENFKFEIILQTDDADRAYSLEKQLICFWNLVEKGYNISIGGKSPMLGKKHSKETKEKIRKANTGKKYSDTTKEKLANNYHNKTDTEKEKFINRIKEANTGRRNSIEHNEKIRQSRLGISRSKETKEKISRTRSVIYRFINDDGREFSGTVKDLKFLEKVKCCKNLRSNIKKGTKWRGWVCRID